MTAERLHRLPVAISPLDSELPEDLLCERRECLSPVGRNYSIAIASLQQGRALSEDKISMFRRSAKTQPKNLQDPIRNAHSLNYGFLSAIS